jgi:hypothetical protein
MSGPPASLWQRLQQLSPASPSPAALGVKLDAAAAALSRAQWADADALLRAVKLPPSSRADADLHARLAALRLTLACHQEDQPAALDAQGLLRKLPPQSYPATLLSMHALRALGDALISRRRFRGVDTLLSAAPLLLANQGEPDTSISYWSARLWTAIAAGAPDPSLSQRASAEAQRALQRASANALTTPSQRQHLRAAAVELSLHIAARSDSALTRDAHIAHAQHLFDDANPFTLDPKGRLLYAMTFLHSPSPWKRVRALDLLDLLGGSALSAAATLLLQRHLSQVDLCARVSARFLSPEGRRGEPSAAPELDRLRAAVQRLLPADAQAAVTQSWAVSEALERALIDGDPTQALLLWRASSPDVARLISPLLDALTVTPRSPSALGEAAAGLDLAPLWDDARLDPVAFGCALLLTAARPHLATPSTLRDALARLSDPSQTRDGDLRPLSLLLPALLGPDASPLSQDLLPSLRAVVTRYLSAKLTPAFGLPVFAERLYQAQEVALAAHAALRALDEDASGASAPRMAALITAAARRAIDAQDLADATRWLEALRARTLAATPNDKAPA